MKKTYQRQEMITFCSKEKLCIRNYERFICIGVICQLLT